MNVTRTERKTIIGNEMFMIEEQDDEDETNENRGTGEKAQVRRQAAVTGQY